MTTLGKILVFVNLVVAVAILSWSTTLYAARPGWFDPKPEGVSPGHEPQSFAQLKEDIDTLGRAAVAAGREWGVQRNRLEAAEKQRADRLKGYAERLQWAREGRDPKDPNSPGFFAPVYDSRGLLDLSKVGEPILGDDNRPLRGVNKLGAGVAADVAEIVRQNKEAVRLREEFGALAKTIADTETRLLKMGVIRDAVQAELFHLGTFEVNVYETRETVLRRKRQLAGRLAELGAK